MFNKYKENVLNIIMTKYVLEGQIDFYSELYNGLDDNQVINDDNKCLITGQELVDKFVTLGCGHKFNYTPLYNDIKNHKQKFNTMESISTHLKSTEIRCPYCREKHNKLLPYYEELNLPKLHGVNHLIFQKLSSNQEYVKKCDYTSAKTVINNDTIEVLNIKCYKMGTQINYTNGQLCGENYDDEKYYCQLHKKQMVKMYKKDIINKEKTELKVLKNNAKIEMHNLLNKLKQEAKLKKETEQTDPSSNYINQMEHLMNELFGCNEILKTGLKKGQYCNCTIVNENMCKRHYNIKLKKSI